MNKLLNSITTSDIHTTLGIIPANTPVILYPVYFESESVSIHHTNDDFICYKSLHSLHNLIPERDAFILKLML